MLVKTDMGVRRKDKNEEDLVSAGGGCLQEGKGLKGDRYMKFYCPLGVHVDMYRTGNILFLSAGGGRGGVFHSKWMFYSKLGGGIQSELKTFEL